MAMGGKNERGYRIGIEEASGGFIVPTLAPSLQASQAIGDPNDQVAYVVKVANTLKSQRGKGGGGIGPEETLVADTVRSHPRPGSNSNGNMITAPLSHGSNPNSNMAGRRREDDESLVSFDAEVSNQGAPDDRAILTRKLKRALSSESQGVRRLTPIECERLQSLPDGWTDLGGTADSKRYAALGDAVTASVAEWIGRRLAAA